MKVYSGDRTIDGVKVTVDGAPLDPSVNIVEFTKNGFEWSYEGPEPRQLALALLVDHLGDSAIAKAMVEPFMSHRADGRVRNDLSPEAMIRAVSDAVSLDSGILALRRIPRPGTGSAE